MGQGMQNGIPWIPCPAAIPTRYGHPHATPCPATEQHGIPCCGFLGEECITLELHPELEELHHR